MPLALNLKADEAHTESAVLNCSYLPLLLHVFGTGAVERGIEEHEGTRRGFKAKRCLHSTEHTGSPWNPYASQQA
ncbi:Importin subunit alpha-6 [Clarias magur]|uniref:Importin subunit alpha-6 n=1 Tax=Clarias magur TaxID=1594786 RepID=A0A8J4U3F2_CLAMG|nr:Importin subunit alpha-6 [Clarias magur]